jgi:hypothetical protein
MTSIPPDPLVSLWQTTTEPDTHHLLQDLQTPEPVASTPQSQRPGDYVRYRRPASLRRINWTPRITRDRERHLDCWRSRRHNVAEARSLQPTGSADHGHRETPEGDDRPSQERPLCGTMPLRWRSHRRSTRLCNLEVRRHRRCGVCKSRQPPPRPNPDRRRYSSLGRHDDRRRHSGPSQKPLSP